jgi:phosphoglycolate phosphatase
MTNIALIFDLDGTLIDSAPDLRAALNRVLATRGLPPHDVQTVRRMIGDGAKVLVDRAWAAHGRQAAPAELADFLEDYEANSVVETIVYPGMRQALAELAGNGHPLAICTNKPAAPTSVILEKLGLLKFFPVVIGGNSTPYRKPDPRHLAAAVTALGAASAIMIGDHQNDMAAASGLNIPSIFVTWGYGQSQGTYTANEAAELPSIVKQAVLF